MRLAGFCLLLLPLAGICAAQDTNFPTGPQYLITYGSPLFLHSIATPSMNLDAPLPSVPPPVIETSTADLSSAPASTPNPVGLASILWGAPTESVIEITSEEPSGPLPAEHRRCRSHRNDRCVLASRTRIWRFSRGDCGVVEGSQRSCEACLHQQRS